jgi:hypothetical protein
VEVRSRTGNELDLDITYHDKNGKEVTARKYDKLIPSFKGRIDTTFSSGADWSPWSKIYLEPGEAFLSPSPRRFMELEVALVSERPAAGALLDWLAIEFDDPLAHVVVGEIFPVEVAPGERTEFAYYIRPQRVTGTGFDRLVVETTAPIEFVGLWIDGMVQVVDAEMTDAGFEIVLDAPVRRSALLELRFAATVFVNATRFDAFIADSNAGALARQRVDVGDANAEIASSTHAVRLPVGPRLLANVSMGPQVISPNGDGINDALAVRFDLINVLAPRAVGLRVFDLAGRLVWKREEEGRAGGKVLAWAGDGADGGRVPPGTYIVELRLEGDGGDQTQRRIIAVVY